MSQKRVHLTSIGCKLNAHETELIAVLIRDAGFTTVKKGEETDYIILNSCTVTGRSDQRTRNLLRSAKRNNPNAIVIVTGCSVQTSWQTLRDIEEVDYIRGNLEKDDLPSLLAHLEQGGTPPRCLVSDMTNPGPLKVPILKEFRSLSRPFIKIQDGCDNRCTYCAIPAARGPQRSSPPEKVLAQVKVFTDLGFNELVLSGVHLGAYGVDLKDYDTSLQKLLQQMLDDPNCPRLRVSSLEPLEFTDELNGFLIEQMNDGRICRHLHIPLQSGCDYTLSVMNRRYTTAQYQELVHQLTSTIPNLAIGADVLIGFPGESDEHFATTFDFVKDLPLAYLHVFSYSIRPGTPAAEMKEQINPEVKKARAARMRKLSEEKRRSFLQSQIGQTLPCIVIQPSKSKEQTFELLADNYVKILVDDDGNFEQGTKALAKAQKVLDQEVAGIIV